MDRLELLVTLLRQLASLDTAYDTFGASEHRYILNTPVDSTKLVACETDIGFLLPTDYRDFLLRLGNGGAGPYYGLYSLECALAEDPDRNVHSFLSTPFPLANAFNPYSKDATDDEMFDDKWISGSIVLAHQGCGYYDRLVICGPQRGMVWSDGRVSDQGIVPLQCDFYDWYHSWLTDSLSERQQSTA